MRQTHQARHATEPRLTYISDDAHTPRSREHVERIELDRGAGIFDYRLGDHIIDYPLSLLDVVSSERTGRNGGTFIKVNEKGGTHVSLTFSYPSDLITYIEHDWIDRTRTAKTALNIPGIKEFTYGKTRTVDIQEEFGALGFHYRCRAVVEINGGVVSFISYQNSAKRDRVYTFVVEYSQDMVDMGLINPARIDIDDAILVATIVARPDYLGRNWCWEREEYNSRPEIRDLPPKMSFADFLPPGAPVTPPSEWEVETGEHPFIGKSSALDPEDRLMMMPRPPRCETADLAIFSKTSHQAELVHLIGKEIQGAFNILLVGGKRVPLQAPVLLDRLAGIGPEREGQGQAIFAAFWLDSVNIARIATAEGDVSVFGFSIEFERDDLGLQNGYWSLEGLYDAVS